MDELKKGFEKFKKKLILPIRLYFDSQKISTFNSLKLIFETSIYYFFLDKLVLSKRTFRFTPYNNNGRVITCSNIT